MAMTAGEKRLAKLLKEMRRDHKKDIGFRYPDAEGNDRNMKRYMRRIEEVLRNESTPLFATDVFRSLARWYLDNCQYQILTIKDMQTAHDYYALGAVYAYLAVAGTAQVFKGKCSESSYWVDTVFQHISRSLIAGWEAEYVQMNEWAIESIDYGRYSTKGGGYDILFIGNGTEMCPVMWFLLDLYCAAYGRGYSKENADYPEDMAPYDQVLRQWDTEDETEVDRLVYILSEHHLDQTRSARSNSEYYAFEDPDTWLYPYEILSWLAIRENKGLSNPKAYSHALMNTEVAQFFLALDKPLARPKEVPYAKELLERLKAICPEVEIPAFLIWGFPK